MKTKALLAVAAQLICAFGFSYPNCWFSHAAVHMLLCNIGNLLCVSARTIAHKRLLAKQVSKKFQNKQTKKSKPRMANISDST